MKLAPVDQKAAQPVIEAPRAVLRPLRRSDAGLISLHPADERVARMTTSIPHPLPPGATEALIARATDPKRVEDIWAMVVRTAFFQLRYSAPLLAARNSISHWWACNSKSSPHMMPPAASRRWHSVMSKRASS